MKKRVEELLKKAKNITPRKEHLFKAEVYYEYQKERITSYDRFFLFLIKKGTLSSP